MSERGTADIILLKPRPSTPGPRRVVPGDIIVPTFGKPAKQRGGFDDLTPENWFAFWRDVWGL